VSVGHVLEGSTSKPDRLDLATNKMLRPITLSRAPAATAIAAGGSQSSWKRIAR